MLVLSEQLVNTLVRNVNLQGATGAITISDNTSESILWTCGVAFIRAELAMNT